jgi:hypothetical protein
VSPKQVDALKALGRLLTTRPWVSARQVWEAGGGRSVVAAGRLCSDLAREGLVQVWRASTGRTAAALYRFTIDGYRCLEIEERWEERQEQRP